MKLHAAVRIALFALSLAIAFVAGQFSSRTVAAQSRVRWEYQIVSGFHEVDKINALGEDGWEAITLNAGNRILLRRSK